MKRPLRHLMEEPLRASVVCTLPMPDCGTRRGEALRLGWRHFDGDAPLPHVEQQYTDDKTLRPPRSKMSRRTIAVNDMLTDYLDRWKAEQREQLGRHGLDQNKGTPIVNEDAWTVCIFLLQRCSYS